VIRIQAGEFARLKVEADKFDKAIIRSLRKRLRALAQVGVDAVKASLALDPPGDQPGSAGSRDAVAAATKATISFTPRGGGVKIVAANSRLDPEHKGFVRAYESRALRHPVFGQAVYVDQPTRPYFGAAIHDAIDDRVQKEMKAAIDDAVRAIGGRVR
jgi:hypothetical protein